MNDKALRGAATTLLILAILAICTFIGLYITQRKTVTKVVPTPHAAITPKSASCPRAKNLTIKSLKTTIKPEPNPIGTGSLSGFKTGFVSPVPPGVITTNWGTKGTDVTDTVVKNTAGSTVKVTSFIWKDIWLQGFLNTVTYPLLEAPESLGYCAVTSDGSQILTSTQPLTFGFGQLLYDKKTQDYALNSKVINTSTTLSAATGAPNRILRKTDRNTGNPIAYCGQTDRTKYAGQLGSCTVDQQCFAVGSVGVRSIKLSQDETRLYVAYLSANAHTSTSTPVQLDFNQASGRVAVFTRLKDPNTGKGQGNDWQYEEALSLQNPGGANAQGITLSDHNTDSSINDYQAYSRKVIHDTGDGFGSLISTSFDRITGDRLLAIKANFGSDKALGPQVLIYHEDKKLNHLLEGVLTLPTIYYKDYQGSGVDKLNYSNTVQAIMRLNSFAWDFDIGDNFCFISYFTGDVVQSDQTVFLPNTVLIYKKINGRWDYTGNIPTPTTAYDPDGSTSVLKNLESFGTSIRTNCDGTLLLVGSPKLNIPNGSTYPNISQGGSVYLFQYDSGSWVMRNRVQDTGSNIKGGFGMWVNVDPTFRIATCSANTKNEVSLSASATRQSITCTTPGFCCSTGILNCKYLARLVVISIQEDKNGVVSIVNPNDNIIQQSSAQYIDPYFGCSTNIAIYDNPGSDTTKSIENTINIFVPSILEQEIHIYQLNTKN